MTSLRCENLCKAYDGIHALDGVNLAFPPTGIIAIVGPNGAGKSTLLSVMTGFIRSDEGKVFLGKQEITQLPPHRIANLGIARTFQDLRLISQISVLENVMLARPRQRGEGLFYSLLRVRVNTEEIENRLVSMRLLRFVGLGEKFNELAVELSYGQQKLLTLAMCLATEATVLLLDEPVAGVHPEMAQKITALLLELKKQGKLVVFVEHDMNAVRSTADSVIVMDYGKIIAIGPPVEVLCQPSIMEAFIG